MRIPLIWFGLLGVLAGVLLSLVSLSSVSSAKHDVTIAKAGESSAVLNNMTGSYVRDPEAEAEIDEAEGRVRSAKKRLETWQSRRNTGFAVTAIGAVVALVGFATPKAQQVEIVEGASRRGGSTPVLPDPAARGQRDGGSFQERLQTLQELRDVGALSDEEYASRRKSIIDSI